MRWTDTLRPDGILVEMQNISKEEALRELLEYGYKQKVIPYPVEEILSILMEREKLISTGVGHGIALPHAKCDFCEDFISLLGISGKGIHYDAADGKPVHIVSIVIGPKDQPNKNIKILARIARLLDQKSVREALMQEKDPDQIFRFLVEAENRIEG